VRGAAALALAALVGGVVTATAGPAAGKEVPPVVARTTLDLVDASRPTPPNGDYGGAPDRALPTVVSYPTRGGRALRKLPLVVFATGFGGDSTNYEPLYDHWVRAGYAVAAPTFPLSRAGAPGGPTADDLHSQPGDVRFVLDRVLAESRKKGSALHGLVDPTRIGLAGKSLGAITALLDGYDPTEHEPRFRAVVAMTGLAMGSVRFDRYDTPLLLVHGDADTTVPIQGSIDAYAAAQPPKFFVTVFGADHKSAFDGGTAPASQVVNRTTTDFFDAYVKGARAAVRRLERDGDVHSVASIQATPRGS
jgi:predicted dienelactone hydrolase